jgi:hypothetical protein
MAAPKELYLEKCLDPWLGLQSPQIDGLKTAAVVAPAKAYERNLRRVYALTIFPPMCITAVSATHRITYEKKLEHRRELSTHKLGKAAFEKIVSDAFQEYTIRRNAVLRAGGEHAQRLQKAEIEQGFGVLAEILVGSLSDGGDAWLSAQVSGVWTAFEALAEEIWIAALNAHPKGLAELNGTKKGSGEDKKIDLLLLQRFGYDLSESMEPS